MEEVDSEADSNREGVSVEVRGVKVVAYMIGDKLPAGSTYTSNSVLNLI
jgi:hypothetical protein